MPRSVWLRRDADRVDFTNDSTLNISSLVAPVPAVERHAPLGGSELSFEELFRRLAERLPEPETELEYANPYTLLVAVVLSAQATDASVNKATEPLFEVADTPRKMLALGEARLRE